MPAEFNERTWLTWLGKVRIVILLFVTAGGLAISGLTRTNIEIPVFLTVMGAWFAIGCAFILLRPFWTDWQLLARIEVLTDLVFAAAVIYVTGSVDTTFNFL